ncbi:MAG: UDP-N-acetylmuramoyl-L-alanine--D-glutamate ligase [Andreesenia angusta]|nr:UDP-N-acetylmuramoyl-L-alanine--D-glutamate ligase [Andreesenia angusta]
MKKLKGKRVLVTGLGISGIAAVKALAKLGAEIVVTDMKTEDELKKEYEEIKGYLSDSFLGTNDIDLSNIDLILKSPGMPLDLEIFNKARDNGIEIISDIEFAYRISNSKFICITGTNGKTTSTILAGEVFKEAYDKVHIVGNVGVGILSKIEELKDEESIFIIEASSFQLESTKDFKPYISLITNITPDHLNWHGNYQNYIKSKSKIFKNQSKDDFTIINYDDEVLRGLETEIESKLLYFSHDKKVKGVYIDEKSIVYYDGNIIEEILKLEDIILPGKHNLENIMGVIAIAKAYGIESSKIRKVIENFKGVEHRLEFVDEIDQIKYYNDSKGTNIDSTIKAIEGLEGPINLIAGGKDKGGEFDELIKAFNGKIDSLILIGETAERIEKTAREYGFNKIFRVNNMKEAVLKAREKAKSGFTVLLSPACASWDMYDSYEIRGRDFKENVKSLKVKDNA